MTSSSAAASAGMARDMCSHTRSSASDSNSSAASAESKERTEIAPALISAGKRIGQSMGSVSLIPAHCSRGRAARGNRAGAGPRRREVHPPVHDAWWAAARKAHGDVAGTTALVEVLLLHRRMDGEHVVAGLAVALRAGALTADAVALEARRAADDAAGQHPDCPRGHPEIARSAQLAVEPRHPALPARHAVGHDQGTRDPPGTAEHAPTLPRAAKGSPAQDLRSRLGR